MRRVLLGLLCALGAVSSMSPLALAGPAGEKDAAAAGTAPGSQWSVHGGTPSEQRYSPLQQINADNVGQLGLAWFADLSERGQWQTTPIVVDGRIYITTPWSKLYAFDAASGQLLWKVDPKVPRELAATSLCCNNSNRGATYWNGKIIWGTLDGRLLAVHAKDGSKVWEAQTTDPKDAMTITGAPRVGGGLVYIGQGGGEFFQRGFLSAWDAETGKLKWKFYVVPGNPAKGPDGAASDSVMPMAAKTWSGEWWKTGGGGPPWDGIVYDPQTGLVIFGTGNGAPWPAALRSPGGGDNLFTASIVAVDAKTGQYRWHYQAVPKDNYDFDNTAPLTTADLVIDGHKKHVVMQIPKDGVFYVIEAATGKVLSAQLVVPFANWLTGFDKAHNFKPILNPESEKFGTSDQGFYVVPFQTHVWYPQSFNPQTGLMYFGVRYATFGMVAEAGATMGNQLLWINIAKRPQGAAPQLDGAGMWLAAWDPVHQKEVWRSREGTAGAGTLTTAGNLVFQGTLPHNFTAFRADTGEKLWSADSGTGIAPGAVSYALGGVQYIAVVAGGAGTSGNRLLVYKLGGQVSLPRSAEQPAGFPGMPPPPPPLNPPEPFGTPEQIALGQEKYAQNCTICHEGARMMGGFPDLRYTPLLMSAEGFKAVVYDGVLTENGMLSFNKALSVQDVEAIRAHLTALANDLKKHPPPAFAGFPGPPPAPPGPAGKPYGTSESPPVGLYQSGTPAWPPQGSQPAQPGPQPVAAPHAATPAAPAQLHH